jgi:VanZ family protein
LALDPVAHAGNPHVRATCVFYALLICHLSLYPYTDWRNLGVGAWEYWLTPWIPPQQRFLTVDAAMNLLAYIPLGSLLLVSLPARWRQFGLSMLLALLLCSGLSAVLEAIQTFLPSRVPSKMDWLFNTLGAVIGIALARSVLKILQTMGLLSDSSGRFVHEGSWDASATVGLWLFCLIAPLPLPYVMGPWLGDIWLFFADITGQTPLETQLEWLSEWEESAQTLATVCGLTGALTLGLAQTHAGRGRLPLFLCLLGLTLLLGWLGPQALPLMQGLDIQAPALRWGNPGLLSVTAASLLGLCLALSDWGTRRLALLSLVCIVIAVTCTLALPGYSQMALKPQAVPTQRTLEHLIAAADWIGAIWPALGALTAWRLLRLKTGNRR